MPVKSIKQTKVIILDFDGVIVESVGIKDRAFYELYQGGHPDHIDAIMSYHLAHNATIRFKKFKYISENILKRTYTLEDERLLSNRFSDLIFKEIVATFKKYAKFVATFCSYEPSPEDQYPEILASPHACLHFRIGDAFDFSVFLCSLLLGSGYDAFVCTGYAPKEVALRD